MMTKVLFDIVFVMVLIGVTCLLLVMGDVIFNLIYSISPRFRRYLDEYCESIPWDDEEGSSNEQWY